MSIVEKQAAALERVAEQLIELTARLRKLEAALERIRDCDWPGPLPLVLSRADWMQQVAKEALE